MNQYRKYESKWVFSAINNESCLIKLYDTLKMCVIFYHFIIVLKRRVRMPVLEGRKGPRDKWRWTVRKAVRRTHDTKHTSNKMTVGINEPKLHGQLLKNTISIREWAHINHNSDSIPDSGDCGKGINQTSVCRCAKKADVCRFQRFGRGGEGVRGAEKPAETSTTKTWLAVHSQNCHSRLELNTANGIN